MDSFQECVERLYTDSCLDLALDRGELVFSPEVDERLVTLGELLKGIDAQRGPKRLVEDPAMDEVRGVATDLLGDLDSMNQ